jgi:hypothetical protein
MLDLQEPFFQRPKCRHITTCPVTQERCGNGIDFRELRQPLILEHWLAQLDLFGQLANLVGSFGRWAATFSMVELLMVGMQGRAECVQDDMGR